MWRTTFAFQNWHSAIELKRYMLRFLQEFPRIHTLGGVRRTALNQYDAVVRPLAKWLAEQGVVFEYGTRVTDVDFAEQAEERRVEALHCVREGRSFTYSVGRSDFAFITIGSMTADSRNGDDTHAPELVRDKRDGAWTLWENMARNAPGLGRPYAFSGNVEESKWESFTLTMRSPLLIERLAEFSGDPPGTGGLMTFRDSSWLLSIVVPHPPHFTGQPEDVYTLWGYGLFIDNTGDYIDKTMALVSGQEILTELMRHLDFADILDEVRRTTTVIPVMMPYITSEFQRRDVADRPPVIPQGAGNFALLGQYVEIPEDVVFTVEYSVRGAMHAVYGLLGLKNEIPPIYHAITDPTVAMASLRTLMGSVSNRGRTLPADSRVPCGPIERPLPTGDITARGAPTRREEDRMAWLTANWFWVVIFIAFIALHLFGHGSHGGHGGHGGEARPRNTDDTEKEVPNRDTTTRSGGHQH